MDAMSDSLKEAENPLITSEDDSLYQSVENSEREGENFLDLPHSEVRRLGLSVLDVDEEDNLEEGHNVGDFQYSNSEEPPRNIFSNCVTRLPLRCMIMTCVFFAIVIPVIALSVVPSMAQKLTSQSSLTLVNATLHDPTKYGLLMDSILVLDNTGGYDFTVERTNVTLGLVPKSGFTFTPFAWMYLPTIDIKANTPTKLNHTTFVHVTNDSAFAEATANLMSGNEELWRIEGNARASLPYGLGHVRFQN